MKHKTLGRSFVKARSVMVAMLAAWHFYPATALATEGFSTGRDLSEWCRQMEEDDTAWGLCVGSITAGNDMIATYQNAADVNIVVCMPKGLTRGDAVKAVIKYMDTHPSELEYSLGDLVFAALAESFPCKR